MERNLMFCSLGNGISVCDTLHEEHGDYVNIAHIDAHRNVIFHKRLEEEYKDEIMIFAKIEHPDISSTQNQKKSYLNQNKEIEKKQSLLIDKS